MPIGRGPRWAAAFDRLDPPKRRLLIIVAIAAGAALVAAIALPMHDAVGRAREDVARNRLLLDIAKARVAENLTLARASAPERNADLRTAIDRVLAAQGLRYVALDAGDAEGGQRIVIASARFDLIVRALDALAHHEGVRVVDATLTPLVEPGMLRAELALAH